MITRPESDGAKFGQVTRVPGHNLDIRRLLPSENPNPTDRATAWQDWWEAIEQPVLKFIRCKNGTRTEDEEILADAMYTAYMEVERGRYQVQAGVPFTAYVKGIARNMILETHRREQRSVPLEEAYQETEHAEFESAVERSEEHAVLRLHLAELPPRRRQVLLMCSEGHETPHIARNLGIREDLVRQEKSRGLQTLRRKMGVTVPTAKAVNE